MQAAAERAWWRDLTGYHWFVFLVASAAWFFDCLDQRLFSLARIPAVESLTITPALIDELGQAKAKEKGLTTSPDVVKEEGTKEAKSQAQALGKEVTAMFLVGWGIGGLIFGALGDRYGRARMLTITVLIYSAFTGLTFFSRTYWDFALCRFLTGLGVGGVFGLAVALIAETVSSNARTGALGMLQILSTIGNIAAGLFKSLFDTLQASGTIQPGTGWRWMFLVGAIPAVLVIFTGKFLREPEPWLRLKEAGKLPTGGLLAPYRDLLKEKRWRKNLIIGALLASTGVIGLWAIGEYAVDLQRNVFKQHFLDAGVPADQVDSRVGQAITRAYVLQMLGAAAGMWAFTRLAMAIGRRPAFLIGFSSALAITLAVYWKMNSPQDAYWMMPLMGGAQLASFAGFAIYLPELFPSAVRSTGTSFCYNLGRFAAAGGSLFSAKLATGVYGHHGSPLMERYSAMTMCVIFLVGILTLPFAPETKGQPLPE